MRLRILIASVLFPIVLWAFATLFFGGDIGKWNDDYFFSTRDPVTNQMTGWAVTTREPYLPPEKRLQALRPLLHSVVPSITSLCWDEFWMAHVIGAIGHGLMALLLYRVMRGLGRSVHAAAGAAALFMVWAVHHEAWVWIAAFGSLFSAILFQCMTLCMIRFARKGGHASGARGWPWALLMILCGAAILCFQEQASGAFPALALAYWAVCPDDESLLRRVVRPAVPLAVSGSLVGVYLYLVKHFAQPGLGNDAESYEKPANLFNRMADVVSGFRDNFMLRHFANGAATRGWRVLLDDKAVMAAWLVALAVAWFISARVWVRTPSHGPGAPARAGARSPFVAMFGVCAFLGACLTIAVIKGYPTLSRVTYLPLASALIAASTLFDGVGRLFHPLSFMPEGVESRAATELGTWYRRVCAVALAPILVAGGVMTIGAQSRMREVTRDDDRNGRQLVEQVPNPEPNTVFLPVNIRPRPFRTGQPQFDEEVRSVWERLWSMPYFVKFQYRRKDVYSLGACVGLPIIMKADEQGIEYIWPFGVPFHDPATNRAPIPWQFVIPVVFDDERNLHVVTRLVQPQEGRPALVVEIPQTRELVRQGRIKEREFVMPPLPK